MSARSVLRPPQQERSRRSLERILTAGAELLAERGYDGFAIAELCARAKISAGALYGRFPGKEALILAIHEHSVERMSDEAVARYEDDDAWQELTIDAFIERAVSVLLEHFREHAMLTKVFILRSAVDADMRRHGAVGVGRIAEAFTARMLRRAAEIPHADPEAAIRTAFAIAYETASWQTAFGSDFEPVLGGSIETVDTRLPTVCRLYLLTPAV